MTFSIPASLDDWSIHVSVSRQAAIADISGNVVFLENTAWGHVKTDSRDIKMETISYTLEDLMLKHDLSNVDFIKIDTEGHEFSVLQSSISAIREANPWIFLEFNSFCLSAHGNVNPKYLLTFIFENFHHVLLVIKKGAQENRFLKIYYAGEVVDMLHQNIVFDGSVNDILSTNRHDALDKIKHLIANYI